MSETVGEVVDYDEATRRVRVALRGELHSGRPLVIEGGGKRVEVDEPRLKREDRFVTRAHPDQEVVFTVPRRVDVGDRVVRLGEASG